jgi:hypothetical protein
MIILQDLVFKMKKINILFWGSSIIALTACGRVSNPRENMQAKIDSMVNAKVDSVKSRLKMDNDSIINAKANAKAQEIINTKH